MKQKLVSPEKHYAEGCKNLVTRRHWDLHFLLPFVQAPPEQTPKPLLLFHSESILSISAAEDGKTVGDLYPVSACPNVTQCEIS